MHFKVYGVMNDMYLIQMSGLPGSGKSTLAKAIAANINSIIVDLDIVKSSILKSFNGNIDFKFAGKVSYDILFSLANYYLSQDRNVIIDTPCIYPEILDKGFTLCNKFNATYKYIETYILSIEEVNQRLKKRDRQISQISQVNSNVTNDNEYLELINMMKRPESINYLRLDTSKPLESYLSQAISYIND
jgi:predicted kinase